MRGPSGDVGWREWVAQWDCTHFAIALAFAAFAAMWKAACRHFVLLQVPPLLFSILWAIALVVLAAVLVLYIIRIIIFPSSLARDFKHPRTVNFFFVPVIIGSLLVIAAPPAAVSEIGKRVAFYVLAAYQLGLTIYLYGEWLFGSLIIEMIHPVVFMQVIGFFLLANIAAGLKLLEEALGLFSVGFIFWVLVFVTNFQHNASSLRRVNDSPQPTFFLFIAPPAQAAIAAVMISRAFAPQSAPTDDWHPFALAILFVDLFIYMIIVRLLPTFWTNSFAVSWWAYIFPLSAAASATLARYAAKRTTFWAVLSALLSLIATFAMIIVACTTVWGLATRRLPNNPRALDDYREYRAQLAEGAAGKEDRSEGVPESDVSLSVV